MAEASRPCRGFLTGIGFGRRAGAIGADRDPAGAPRAGLKVQKRPISIPVRKHDRNRAPPAGGFRTGKPQQCADAPWRPPGGRERVVWVFGVVWRAHASLMRPKASGGALDDSSIHCRAGLLVCVRRQAHQGNRTGARERAPFRAPSGAWSAGGATWQAGAHQRAPSSAVRRDSGGCPQFEGRTTGEELRADRASVRASR